MTPEQEIQHLIEALVRTATRHGAAVAGFAFSLEHKFMVNFGNTTDAHKIELYERLVEICDAKRRAGQVESKPIGEVN